MATQGRPNRNERSCNERYRPPRRGTQARTSQSKQPRIRELSKLARELFPDDGGDYVLPDTPIGKYLAIAIVTHLARAGQRNGKWLAAFCGARAVARPGRDRRYQAPTRSRARTRQHKLRQGARLCGHWQFPVWQAMCWLLLAGVPPLKHVNGQTGGY
jgi:hypothetical protein